MQGQTARSVRSDLNLQCLLKVFNLRPAVQALREGNAFLRAITRFFHGSCSPDVARKK